MDEIEKSGEVTDGLSSAAIAGALSKLREHPEIISAVAGALSGGNQSAKSESDEASAVTDGGSVAPFSIEKISEAMTTLAPLLSGMGSSRTEKEIKGSREDHRHALLCALRPYLSRDRREMIDYILKFGKIGDLIKKMK